ncbi:MAG: VCBS domain-containing protein, partial [Alphaproteobacteria bacterium]|nr:VCBS domain-containing protein [Alphaproteobacteria bacterium]
MSDVMISSATKVRATLGAERFLRSIGYTGPIWVSYEDSTAAVVINMTDTVLGTGGFAAGDSFVSLNNLSGSNFGDQVIGNSLNNLILGLDGNDTLLGQVGDDTLEGGNNNDILLGGTGADVIDGGAGFDIAAYWNATTAITLDMADMTVNTGEAAGDSFVSIEQINATAFADSVSGDGAANSIYGGNGNDTLVGRAGNDLLSGDAGDDSLLGGEDADTLQGGAGNDLIDGGAGIDMAIYWNATAAITLDMLTPSLGTGEAAGDVLISIEQVFGTNFNDQISGTAAAERLGGIDGDDTLNGREGNDTLDGGVGNDSLIGGDGQDQLLGGANNDTLRGNDAADQLLGDAGDDSLVGGDGNDTLLGGLGADIIDGGAGHDIAAYWNATAAVQIDLATPGLNTGEAVGDTFVSIDQIVGTAFNDTISGASAADSLSGGVGNDIIEGRDGNDTLLGEAGGDTLRGGNGADSLLGGIGADSLDGGAGDDYVLYWNTADSISIALDNSSAATGGEATGDVFTGIEGVYASLGNDTVLGSNVRNLLFGLAGNDILRGLGGDDLLNGAEGNDVLDGGAGTDSATFNGNRTNFTVERGTFEGKAALIVTGTAASAPMGVDTVLGAERLSFSDGLFFLSATAAADNTLAVTPVLGNDASGNVTGNDVGATMTLDAGAPLAPTVISVEGQTSQAFTSGGGLTQLSVSGTYGTLVMQADGAWTYEIDTAGAAYLSLAAGAAANDVFNYTITPGDTAFADMATITATATLTIQVLGGNRPPALDLDVNAPGKDFTTAASSGASGVRVSGNPAGNSAAWTGDSATAGFAATSNTALTDPDVPPNAPANYKSVSIVLTAASGALNAGEALTLSASVLTTLDVLGTPYSLTATTIDVDAGSNSDFFMTSSLVQSIIKGVTYANPETSFDLNANGRIVSVTVTDRLGGFDSATATIMTRASVTATGTQTNFVGTALSDSITGNALANELNGAAGNDVLSGAAGNDLLTGGLGNDTLLGGNDSDTLQGDAGTNSLDGGADADTAGYAGLRSAFTVTAGTLDGNGMATSWASVTGAGISDTLTSIEKLRFDDVVLDVSAPVQLFNGTTLLGTFSTIQAAVNAAVCGNIVKITGTTLTEDVVVNGKAITIDGSGKTGPGATTLIGSITFTGTLAAGQVITVQDMAINASGKGWGINVGMAGADFTTGLVVDNVAVSGAINNGLAYTRTGNGTSNPMLTDTIGSITVSNSDFTDNGVGGPLGSMNLSFYGYNRDVTLTNVTLSGAPGSLKAMQLRGTESAGPVYAAGGSVSFNDVTVNG